MKFFKKMDKLKGKHKILLIVSALVILIAIAAVIVYFCMPKPPEYITDFCKTNPEASEFANGGSKYHDKDLEIDVTQEMEASSIPLFIQGDKRWGYKPYGNSVIGVSGCGPTALAMVACGLTKNSNINPAYVAALSMENKYYNDTYGTSGKLMTAGAKQLGLKATEKKPKKETIQHELSENYPIICSVKSGDFTTEGHFIVLTKIENDEVTLNDPNSPEKSSKTGPLDRIQPQINNMWVYSVA